MSNEQRTALEYKFLGTTIATNDPGLLLLTDEDWYSDPVSKAIFKILRSLIAERTPLDKALVLCRLETEHPNLHANGFDEAIANERDKLVPYWEQLKTYAIANQAMETSHKITDITMKHGTSKEKIMEAFHQSHLKMLQIYNQGMLEINVNDIFKEMDDEKKKETEIFYTGFEPIDAHGGYQKDYMFLAAQYGIGKTPFALRIMLHNAVEKNIPLIYFSGENRNQDILKALLAMMTGISLSDIRQGKQFSVNERKALNNARERIAKAPIHFLPNGRIPAHKLEASIKKIHERHGTKIVILDQFSHIEPPSDYGKRNDNLDALADLLYQWKFDMPHWYVTLAQLRTKIPIQERPSFKHFMFCSQPEQNTDIGMILDRPAQDRNRMAEEKKQVERECWMIDKDETLSFEEKIQAKQDARKGTILPGQALARQEKGRLGYGTFEVPLGWDEHSLGFYTESMIPPLHPFKQGGNKQQDLPTPFDD